MNGQGREVRGGEERRGMKGDGVGEEREETKRIGERGRLLGNVKGGNPSEFLWALHPW